MSALTAYLKQPAEPSTRRAARPRRPIATRSMGTRSSAIRTACRRSAPPWGTLNAIDLVKGELLWKVPLGEYPQLVAKGHSQHRHDEFRRRGRDGRWTWCSLPRRPTKRSAPSRQHSGRVLWEHQLPAGGYATPSVYMVDGREYVAIAAGGGGKNATKSGDSIIAFALPWRPIRRSRTRRPPERSDWIRSVRRRDVERLGPSERRAHLHRRRRRHRRPNRREQREHELVPVHDAGVRRLRARARDRWSIRVTNSGHSDQEQGPARTIDGQKLRVSAGRVNGPQVEVRRFYKGSRRPACSTAKRWEPNWLSSQEKIDQGITSSSTRAGTRCASSPRSRIQTWVNGHAVEDLVNEESTRRHPKGFIGLQIHGLSEREVNLHPEFGITPRQPLTIKWRHIRIRPLTKP